MLVYLHPQNTTAEIAQLVEHDLAKVGVAGSSPVFRSKNLCKEVFFYNFVKESVTCPDGGIGRHPGLKILWPLRPCRFEPGSGYKGFLMAVLWTAFFFYPATYFPLPQTKKSNKRSTFRFIWLINHLDGNN